jgi:CBS domain-containing protein
MPDYNPSNEIKELAVKVASDPFCRPIMGVKDLLGQFNASARGDRVTRDINAFLRKYKILTEPDYEEVSLGATVTLVPRPTKPAKTTEEEILPQSSATSGGNHRHQIRILPCASKSPSSIIKAPDNVSLDECLTIMLTQNVGHLLVGTTRNIAGILTWEAYARKAHGTNLASKICLDDVIDKNPRVILETHSLLDAVDEVAEIGYVVVKNVQKEVCGIVTAKDIAREFVPLAKPFFLLALIEHSLRRLIDSGNPSLDEIKSVIREEERSNRPNLSIADLTLGESIALMMKIADKLPNHPSILRRIQGQLQEVNKRRNDIMHFRQDPAGPEEIAILENCRRSIEELSLNKA